MEQVNLNREKMKAEYQERNKNWFDVASGIITLSKAEHTIFKKLHANAGEEIPKFKTWISFNLIKNLIDVQGDKLDEVSEQVLLNLCGRIPMIDVDGDAIQLIYYPVTENAVIVYASSIVAFYKN